jgi:hypothetical protein
MLLHPQKPITRLLLERAARRGLAQEEPAVQASQLLPLDIQQPVASAGKDGLAETVVPAAVHQAGPAVEAEALTAETAAADPQTLVGQGKRLPQEHSVRSQALFTQAVAAGGALWHLTPNPH